MKTGFITATTLLLTAAIALAHGEDKFGPNNGFVRMPGAYHTEVVPAGDDQFRVYLLDINWKNPSVKSSQVKAALTGKKKAVAKCEVQTDHFLCKLDNGAKLSRGTLVLETTRENQKGAKVTYPLPFKLEKKTPAPAPEQANPHAHH